MFKNAIHNISGYVPFNPKAFPMRISTGANFRETKVCHEPSDIPQGVDFIIDATGIADSEALPPMHERKE
jgi:hypothetical protein